MPRKARDEKLDTRTARLRLSTRREPYWRNIQEGHAVGYRRLTGGKGGTWIARRYSPGAGRLYQSLGSADDYLDADGASILTFAQAQDRAAAWFRELATAAGHIETPITVREAVDAYLLDYSARGGKTPAAVAAIYAAHVLPTLGERKVKTLTAATIRAWHHGLANAPARLRSAAKATKPASRKVDAGDTEGRRARRATANRLLTALKAALNHAFKDGRVVTDAAWRQAAPFRNVDAPRVRYLTDAEANRLVNASPPDLRALVTAALLTGCRYGELVSLRPADLDLAAGMVTIRAGESKSGKVRGVVLTDEARRFFEAAAAGKSATALLLTRANGAPWGKSHQFRPLREACSAANISPAASFHILRHTHASRLAMRGVPMAVIAAQLGHSDLKTTARHYAHVSPSYVADTVRAAFGDLGLVPGTNVTPMRAAERANGGKGVGRG